MNIIILSFEPNLGDMLQLILEAEGYPCVFTASADDVIRAIEGASGPTLLLADNFHLSPEAQQAFTAFRDHPELRSRVTIVGLSGMIEGARQWMTDNVIDDHVALPFTLERLLHIIEAHAGRPPY